MTSNELLDFMMRHGLTVQEFSDLFGVTYGATNHWLTGRRTISLTVSRLCKLFDAHPELMQEFGK